MPALPFPAIGLALAIGVGAAWHAFCKRPPFWITQLDAFGMARVGKKIPGTAVVCGGSAAGIITARVCADHFERVVVVDPEVADADKRKTRVLQYNASHIFLTIFVNAARRLWPDFNAEVLGAGGKDVVSDFQIHYAGLGPVPSPRRDKTLMASRRTMQTALNRLLLRDSRISVVSGTVRGLISSEDKRTVVSVDVRKLDGTQLSLNDVALVVDCTGRTHAGFKWLQSAGYAVTDDIRATYEGNLRYLTITCTVPPALAARLPIPSQNLETSVIYACVPEDDTAAQLVAMFKTGPEEFLIGFTDTAGVELPRTPEEAMLFIAGFRGLRRPIPTWVIETIGILCEDGQPSFDNIALTTLSYLQYHKLPRGTLPANFVAVGDSVMTLNPIHGQGFSKSMLNAIVLNTLLHEVPATVPANFADNYFRRSAGPQNSLWDSTRLNDYNNTACQPMKGETKQTGAVMRWLSMKVLSAAMKYDDVAVALWDVRHLLVDERALLAPTILAKILWTRSLFA
ncbi:hypothetical protein MKEN_00375500 [Mycena kentingensis (nom. inval.)]|nr:hypothetical protein MKEN_00375500 [Mycena kentingensis (nom. inval.)]